MTTETGDCVRSNFENTGRLFLIYLASGATYQKVVLTGTSKIEVLQTPSAIEVNLGQGV